MTLSQRDRHGCLEAFIEYQVVDANGTIDPQGAYIWVAQLEMNPDVHRVNTIRHFIRMIAVL